MALIFFGTPEFAVPSLRSLINENEDIALVVTQPDKLKGRGHVLSSPPVKEFALLNGIRVIQPIKIKEEGFYRELSSINPEFIIVVAYGKILPDDILKIPKAGCINVHASLLPKYRGAAPIQWSLINGEKITGITTMLMDSGLDTGDILLQRELEIEESDNAETLSRKLSLMGANILIDTIKGLRLGNIKPSPQPNKATYAPPLKKIDGQIDWGKSSEQLSNFVRGMFPWPSAFCYLNSERIRILKAKSLEKKDIPLHLPLCSEFETIRDSTAPGRILKASQGELIVETGKGFLLIEELQPEGKKIMTAGAFLSGRKLREGHDKFS